MGCWPARPPSSSGSVVALGWIPLYNTQYFVSLCASNHSVGLEDFLLSIPGGNVTNFVPRKALQLIAGSKLTFDERVVVHHAVS